MRWKNRRQSRNIEDRRGEAIPRGGSRMGLAGGLGIGRLLFSLFTRGSAKIKIMMVVGVIIAMVVFNFNPLSLLGMGPARLNSGRSNTEQQGRAPGKNDEDKKFISAILGANEDVWAKEFPKAFNKRFRKTTAVIYTRATKMSDGNIADANMGPFYYPADEKIYIDPSFFREMETQLGARGDFAKAYVIAHEYGHHIQHLLGLTERLHRQQGRISKTAYNHQSVRLELHADFLAGFFAQIDDKNFNSLERGDIQEAIDCARRIGDDRLQKQATGRVSPDNFTHGTSEQRSRWFMRGYQCRTPREGDEIFTIPYDQL